MNSLIHNSFHKKTSFCWFLISLAIVSYFIFHSIEGQRGFFVLSQLQKENQQAEIIFEKLQSKRLNMERQAMALRTDSLDRDFVEEMVRLKLGYILPDESILLPQ